MLSYLFEVLVANPDVFMASIKWSIEKAINKGGNP